MTELDQLMNPDQLKSKVKRIDLCIPSNELSLVNDMKDISQVLAHFAGVGELDDAALGEMKNYLVGDLLFFACKYILEFKQFSNSDNHKHSQLILQNSVVIAVKLLQSYPELTRPLEVLRLVLDPDRPFYKIKNQIEFNPKHFTPDTLLTQSQIEFIDNLQVDDFVDALKIDLKSQVIDWSRARVRSISDKTITVSWLQDDYTRKIEKYTYDIAPFKSKVSDEDWEWRHNLKPGDLVDCPDENVWYNSTILARTQFEDHVEYRIGYRTYDENGPLTDSEGRKFFGWSSSYDEDIKAANPKIQKLNKFSKKFCKYASMSTAEESIKDHNDFVFNVNAGKKVYVVPRFNTKSQRRSELLVSMGQLFGESGGFGWFLEQVRSKERWCPIEQLSAMVGIVGNLHEALHREFAFEFVPGFFEAVRANMEGSPDANLRNFSQQRVEDVVVGVGLALKRVFSLKEKNEMVGRLEMSVAIRCFKSEFLERKIQGLKLIQDLIKRTKEWAIQNSDLKFLTIQVMVDWVNENTVFESLYQSNSYMIQRSSDFLKFMLEEKLVAHSQLKMICDRARTTSELEDKQAIYKVLKDASQSLQREQLQYLVDYICSLDPLTKDDVELLSDLTRYNYRYKEEFNDRFAAFYLALLARPHALSPELADVITLNYIDLVTSFEMKAARDQQIRALAANLADPTAAWLTLKVLLKFIDKLEPKPMQWDQYSRDVALSTLDKDFHVVQLVIALIKAKDAHLKVYIEFLQFFYDNTLNSELNFDMIMHIWDDLHGEQELVFKWFAQLLHNLTISEDQLTAFIRTRIHLHTLSQQGFNCLKQALTKINNPHFVQDTLFQLISKVQNQAVLNESRLFLIELMKDQQDLLIDHIFARLEAKDDHQDRLLELLESLMDSTEIYGIGDMKGLCQMGMNEKVTIDLENELNYGWKVPRKFKLSIFENDTILDLRVKISQEIKCSWDSIGLARVFNNQEQLISFKQNGQAIRDLRLKRGEIVKIMKQTELQMDEIVQEELVDPEGNLTKKALDVFKKIFRDFSSEGLMNKEQCAQFVTNCTGNLCHQDDQQVIRTFEQYDKDKDNFLNENDFIEFYKEASKSKKSTVWQNLKTLHFRDDLQRGDEVQVRQVDVKSLPRYKIGEKYIDRLYKLLDNEKAWFIMRRLANYKQCVQENKNCELQLLYNLYVIEANQLELENLYEQLQEQLKKEEQGRYQKEIVGFMLKLMLKQLNKASNVKLLQKLELSIEELKRIIDRQEKEQFDRKELVELVEELIWKLLKQEELEWEDRVIIENGMGILISVLDDDYNIDLLMEGLFTPKSSNLRVYFSHAIFLVSYQRKNQNKHFIQKILQVLIDKLPQCIQSSTNSDQYYELLTSLLDLVDNIDYKQLLNIIIASLDNHDIHENVLIGLLHLLYKIISLKSVDVDNAQLIKLIFNDCLFNISQTQRVPVKCRSPQSRAIAFKLLTLLPPETIVNECLLPLSTKIPQRNSYNHIPGNEMKTQYVGIRNLGCICYMNAMLQQFFTNATFKYAILQAEDGEAANMQVKPKDNSELDDNYFHQLQRMFAYLQLSERQDYNPVDFCYSFKDYAGQPVDVSVQQDSQEFLNVIFDKLENSLKPTPFKSILEGVYGGKTTTLLTCEQCKYVKSKEETFYNLSVPMKNLKNIHECLDKFISDETISDYKCDQCAQVVNIAKKQLISKLPNVLILHLQRIVFNLDLLVNEKINSRVEFPLDLDLKNYLLDPQTEHSHYELTGVVVHIGAADYGHYFSYIQSEGTWYEFNDSHVKEFKVSQLENQCFGGGMQSESDDLWWKSPRENSQNAYILVYTKKEKHDILIGNELQRYDSIAHEVPGALREAVLADNFAFQLERNLYDATFFEFLVEIAHRLESIEVMLMLVPYCFDLLARAYENRLLPALVERIKQLIPLNAAHSYQFLQHFFFQRATKTVDLLLSCPESNTRQMVSQVLSLTFNTVIGHFKLTLREGEGENESINHGIMESLKTMFDLLKEQVPKNWIRFDQYFLFWKDILEGGPTQREFLNSLNMRTYLLDFMLDKQSPLHLYDKKHSMGNVYYSPNFSTVFDIVTALDHHLSHQDRVLLYSSRLIEKLLKCISNSHKLSRFFQHMSRDNLLYTEILCSSLLRCMSTFAQDEFQTLLDVLASLLAIQDPYKQTRIEWLLGTPQLDYSKSDTLNFGTYDFSMLDQEVFKYPSPLHYHLSLLDVIASNLGQYKRNDNIGLLAIKCVCQLMLSDEDVKNYVESLPAQNYIYKNFISHFRPYLEVYKVETKRFYYQTFPRNQLEDECQKLLEQIKVPKEVNPSYVIGLTQGKTTKKSYYQMDNRIRPDRTDESVLEILETNYSVYTCKSQPNGYGNDTFASVTKGNVIYNYQVKVGTQLNKFFEQKQWGGQTNFYYNYNESFKAPESNKKEVALSAVQEAVVEEDESQRVEGFTVSECIKLVQLKNLSNQSMHIVMGIRSEDGLKNMAIGESKMQKLVKANSVINMAIYHKIDLEKAFDKLGMEIRLQSLEGQGDCLFMTPVKEEERKLFSYR